MDRITKTKRGLFMESLRETFHLEQYSEEAVDKVVNMQMEGMSVQDIAEAVNLSAEDVDEIIFSTFQAWGH